MKEEHVILFIGAVATTVGIGGALPHYLLNLMLATLGGGLVDAGLRLLSQR